MKNLTTTILLSLVIFSCQKEESHNHTNSTASTSEDFSKKATIPDGFITKNPLGESISVLEARSRNEPAKQMIVEGAICGILEPFTSNRAMFILGDLSIKTCDKTPGDNCPTPWDACCEDRKKIISGSLTVRLLDENGTLKDGTLKNVNGLNAGRKIKVQGVVSTQSIPSSMISNATQIQLL